ncbi:MAG TPA: UDP-N-acetylmuramoyl-tripeptide--D-alanyl-D-alanine ligase, partial [Solirubrobacteraceae bacterium]|nr:UDP-N-acetylmuramoyl-tripeptide--D-alanyl-D-alanine ligase [Solirubrobacteraceae bacterium]
YGVLTDSEHAQAAAAAATDGQVVLAAEDPLTALQRLATAWRTRLGAHVIGVTGSTGKTSTKDLLLAVLSPHRRTIASRANFNTEIGLPLEILAAPPETEILVLEMGMRGPGQIAELGEIARPDVGIIVSVGPVHLELLGSVEAIAAAKAELIAALPEGGTAIVPAGEQLLVPHLRSDVRTVTFGPGGDIQLRRAGEGEVEIDASGRPIRLQIDFEQAHLRRNLLAAVGAALAVGVAPEGRIELALSPGRGQQTTLPSGVVLIDDCYNANPMSMRAALDDLTRAASGTSARRVAVLGDMLELGPEAPRFHAEIGAYANERADVLISVGPLAAEMGRTFAGSHQHAEDAGRAAEIVPELLEAGDVLLVKGSRGVALEQVCHAVSAGTVPG